LAFALGYPMDIANVAKTAFAMPLTSPSFARGPYRYTNRELLVITYRTDRAALEEAVPEPLAFDEPLVRCEFMRMDSSTGFGRYSGAAQHIPVKLNGEAGAYTHNMYLDTYAPISGGRELWGFPQKLAKPTLAVEHDTLVGTLDYGPVEVARGTMGYKHRALDHDAAMRMFNEPIFLLKIIPHVDGTPRICELVRTYRSDVVLHGAWTGPSALDLHPHALAPLTDLPLREVVSAVHLIADFTLPHGDVVHDYLA
jgi:acetoacetate decarboxylase